MEAGNYQVKNKQEIEISDCWVFLEVVASIVLLLLLVASCLTIKQVITLDWNKPEAVEVGKEKHKPMGDEFGFLLRSNLCSRVFDIIIIVLITKTAQKFLSS